MYHAVNALARSNQYKYPFFLLALYTTLLLTTVCLANRITLIGPILAPGGVFLFPLTFCLCDIVGEVYGYAYPRLFIWLGAITELIFALVTTFVSHLPVPEFFPHQQAYQIVFDPTLQYVGSGLVGLLVGEFGNVYLLAKWKIYLNGKFFIIRTLFANAFGQACLTIIVDILNYWNKLQTNELLWMMVCGYFWKMCCAILMLFPAWLLVKYLKNVEQVDHYDLNTNFNPFIFTI